MKNLLAIVLAALLTACGGGEPPEQPSNIPLPFRLASPVTGDTETVLHLYQALYGKAPSNPQLASFKNQIAANGAVSWVNSMSAEFNGLSNLVFAERVLNNISITPTSLIATPTFGASKQAYNALLGGFADYLSMVGVGSRGVVVAQLAKIISNLEVDTQFGVYGSAAASLNRQVLANSAYSQDTKSLEDREVSAIAPRIKGALGISLGDSYDFCAISGQFNTYSTSGFGTWTFSNCMVYGTAGSPLFARLQNNGSTNLTLTQIHVLAGNFGNAWNISPSSQTITPGSTVDFALPLWLGLEVTYAVATFKLTGEPDFIVQLKGNMVLP